MEKILFATDLDNTLLFSHRHRRPGDVCAELLEGAEQGFMTSAVWKELLPAVSDAVTLLPVTTRSAVQYRRIRWPDGTEPAWAVTTNGGILLDCGVPDPDWLEASLRQAAPYQPELARLYQELPRYDWCLRRKMVDGLYLFAVCPEGTCMNACKACFHGRTSLTVEPSGRKLYFFPPELHKGAAVLRARRRLACPLLVCAGDAALDVPMLRLADLALVPDEDLARLVDETGRRVRICPKTERFSEFVLRSVLDFAGRRRDASSAPVSSSEIRES